MNNWVVINGLERIEFVADRVEMCEPDSIVLIGSQHEIGKLDKSEYIVALFKSPVAVWNKQSIAPTLSAGVLLDLADRLGHLLDGDVKGFKDISNSLVGEIKEVLERLAEDCR